MSTTDSDSETVSKNCHTSRFGCCKWGLRTSTYVFGFAKLAYHSVELIAESLSLAADNDDNMFYDRGVNIFLVVVAALGVLFT